MRLQGALGLGKGGARLTAIWASGSKIQKTVVTPYYLAPRKFLTLSFFHAEPPTIHNYSSGFPTSALVPEEVSAHGSPLSQLRFFLSACLSLLF